jgi:poly [ADP-ribose] polymerase 10/14/15
MAASIELRPLRKKSDQFRDVGALFQKSMDNCDIVEIHEACNPLRSAKYEAHRTFLVGSGVNPNERRLFHGTGSACISKILKQGFNRNFAGLNGSVYGMGVYFARDAAYSSVYSSMGCTSDLRKMCVCDVLVGDVARGSCDMKVPPKRPNSADVDDVCDSTVDMLPNSSVFVCYHDDQVPAFDF